MKLAGMLPFRMPTFGLLLLVLLAVSVEGVDLVQKYCSTQNTGSGFGPFEDDYQSLGSCSTKCAGDDYALGIVQGLNCWCSNYVPAEQASISDCSEQCPGYPYENCGNADTGYYGYIQLSAPLGTKGASSPTQKPKSPAKTSTATTSDVSPTPTVTKTVTRVQSPTISVVTSYVTPAPSSSSSSFVSSSSTTSKVMTKITTISGTPVTHTVTSTPMGGVAPNHDPSERPSMEQVGLSGGAIAGVVIGTLAGVALILIAAFFLFRRRRDDGEGRSSGSPKRKGSVLSRTGLLGGARPQSMTENTTDDSYYPEQPTRTNSIRHSMMFGAGNTSEEVAEVSPIGGGTATTTSSQDAGSERRTSRHLVYDQRLNPSALFAHHDNGSRVSMQDQQDYSRPLGMTNPDFPRTYSFDSR